MGYLVLGVSPKNHIGLEWSSLGLGMLAMAINQIQVMKNRINKMGL